RSGTLRAIAGGGRYDKLLETFGGEATPAVGFGLGDAVIMELLNDKGLVRGSVRGALVHPWDASLPLLRLETLAPGLSGGQSSELGPLSPGSPDHRRRRFLHRRFAPRRRRRRRKAPSGRGAEGGPRSGGQEAKMGL
ncbi:hypothetical protein M885DRAFT_440985, partial [Pelagophyceae sp. CCMP2097]